MGAESSPAPSFRGQPQNLPEEAKKELFKVVYSEGLLPVRYVKTFWTSRLRLHEACDTHLALLIRAGASTASTAARSDTRTSRTSSSGLGAAAAADAPTTAARHATRMGRAATSSLHCERSGCCEGAASNGIAYCTSACRGLIEQRACSAGPLDARHSALVLAPLGIAHGAPDRTWMVPQRARAARPPDALGTARAPRGISRILALTRSRRRPRRGRRHGRSVSGSEMKGSGG